MAGCKGRAKGVAAAPPALTASSLDPPGNPDIISGQAVEILKGTLDLDILLGACVRPS